MVRELTPSFVKIIVSRGLLIPVATNHPSRRRGLSDADSGEAEREGLQGGGIDGVVAEIQAVASPQPSAYIAVLVPDQA